MGGGICEYQKSHDSSTFLVIIIPDWLHTIRIHLFPRLHRPFCNFLSSVFTNAINNCTCTSVGVFFPEVSAGIIADKEVITANSAAPWSEDKASVTR